MSRSRLAWAETRWRCGSVHNAGRQRRLEGRLLLERRFPLGAVSATKCVVIMLAAGALVMTAEAAPALAATRVKSPAPAADSVVLAFGSGYTGGTAAVQVRSLQRRLDNAGYTPGPLDGRYGPRTEHAVQLFQSAHGLRVDGIAGPITLATLRASSPVLFPGAGYAGVGSAQVRGLQRQLRHDGFSPGPIDGRYGPVTERAVRRFQAAHRLRVDGVAGARTFGELKRVAAAQRTAPQPRPRTRPTAPSRPPRTLRPRPSRPVAPQPGRPATTGQRHGRTSRTGGASWPVAPVAVGLACLAVLVCGGWLIERRRRISRTAVVEPPGADAAPAGAVRLANGSEPQEIFEDAEVGYKSADQRGDAAAASNLGVVLERRGDLAGAEAAYRRADARGSADGAFNLAGLLLERGDVEGAMHAYHRADERGDAAAAVTLGLMFLERGDEDAAQDAYSRADERGDAGAAVNVGVLCERRGDLAGAEAAYQRADARGSADGAFNLGALFEQRGDLANAADAYRRADERGDAGAAARLGMLLERQHDYSGALEAYARAGTSDQREIAELARSRAQALAFGLSLSDEGQR